MNGGLKTVGVVVPDYAYQRGVVKEYAFKERHSNRKFFTLKEASQICIDLKAFNAAQVESCEKQRELESKAASSFKPRVLSPVKEKKS